MHFEGDLPIYVQIKRAIEDMIVEGRLNANDKVPSTTEMVKFYQVNHITVAKGVNELVNEGIVYKKRGVGMFVAEDAREKLLRERKKRLKEAYLKPLLKEAELLNIELETLQTMMKDLKEEDHED